MARERCWRADAAGGRAIGAISSAARARSALHRQADRAAPDLRRPGGHRHRERAAVQGAGAKNRDLTEALEQQTATSEILRVIASSPTDVQPVFDAIAESAARLCEATSRVLLRGDGDVEGDPARPPDRAIHRRSTNESRPARGLIGRAGDSTTDGRSTSRSDAAGRSRVPDAPIAFGSRPSLASRCCARASPSGVIVIVGGPRSGPFTDKQIALLRDLRRPGGHRDRERPPVQGAGGADAAS